MINSSLKKFGKEHGFLAGVLCLAFFVRIILINNGMPLPQSVNGDESFPVVTALKLLNEHTLLPHFYVQYPLLVPYLNLFLFLPIIFFKLLLNAFNMTAIKSDFIANPFEYYWAGRFITILLGVGTIVWIDRICNLLFKNNRWAAHGVLGTEYARLFFGFEYV
jgi:hypothetical protein